MIPKRIYLKGFMSYRNEAELTFNDGALWVLSGRNGAGKSAIFDAMVFALYGVCRKRQQGFTDLINHDEDALIVEFEFAVGPNTYRVKRTRTKNGQPIFLASHVSGPDAPYPDKKLPQPISGTESEKGLEQWVKQTVGMDYKAFTYAVILEQGQSEKLLTADQRDRHKFLSELIDISAYKRLEGRATAYWQEHERLAEALTLQIKRLPVIEESKMIQLGQEIESLSAEVAQADVDLETLTNWVVHAKTWESLLSKQTQFRDKADRVQELLAEAELIKAQKARLDDLNTALPVLQRLWSECQRLHKARELVGQIQSAGLLQEERVNALKVNHSTAEKVFNELESSRTEQEQAARNARKILADLEPDYQQILDSGRIQTRFTQIDEQLKGFSHDLDERVERGRVEVDKVNQLGKILPYIQQYVKARDDWHIASRQHDEAERKLEELTLQLHNTEEKQQALETDRQLIVNEVACLQHLVSETKAALDQISIRIERLGQIEGQATCEFCGQRLTVEHLERERERLKVELLGAQSQWSQAHQKHQERLIAQTALLATLEQVINQGKQLTRQVNRVEFELKNAQDRQHETEQQTRRALAYLDMEDQTRINPSGTDDVTQWFAVSYPTPDDIQAMNKKVELYERYQTRLNDLIRNQERRDGLAAERQELLLQLDQLQVKLPASKRQEILTRRQETEEVLRQAEAELSNLRIHIDSQRPQLQRAAQDYNTAYHEHQELLRRIAEVKATATATKQAIETTKVSLSGQWLPTAETLTEVQLQNLQAEASQLLPVEERYHQLAGASRELQTYLQQLGEIEHEIEQIPTEAKRPIVELNEQVHSLRKARHDLTERMNDLKAQKTSMEFSLNEWRRIEQERLTVVAKAELYKNLANLLGRDHLQMHLLQQVEASVVEHANDVLDRISGGTLRLELKSTITSTDSSKALDIVAFNSQLGNTAKSLPIDLLSGSQRFRVAVSLALGTGRYISQGSRRIESVIIDEGFGGLDREGRDQMIDELHELRNALQCIILVSHQEEFAEAFREHAYHITLKNGSSNVIRL